MEIREHEVYTTKEVEDLLKVSTSTVKRMLKRGILRANKVGGQYRVLGKELLRLVSPEVEQKVGGVYGKVKRKTKEIVKDW